MKKFINRYTHCLAALAMVFATMAANRCCYYILHQPKEPVEVKALRKF